ncbi:hypothetical protein NIES2101_19310 [Calothrix sp. HK-06]|nr:hypothetical protein NIES2101_19310 [Calothrix sp. HK-06]
MKQPNQNKHVDRFNLSIFFILSKLNIQKPLGLVKNILRWLALAPLASILLVEQVQAQVQPVISATDGTGTIVSPNGNQINITGGQLSRDNANLFHSFTQFGLNAEQIANFLSTPGIQNILGRVVGGNASVINGQIQVTGSNANLFLMNPAGIIFGNTATLNVPGAFTATTANGIGFGTNWFNASGTNNYADLVGSPGIFSFAMSQPGAIFNAGNLAVGKGQNLTLLGGTVVNTGSVTAPEGQILVSAVPGERLVRLSQAGSPLSLEIQPLTAGTQAANWNLPILSLPQLLTSGGGANANKLTINNDGKITLSGSGIPVENGDVVTGNVTTKTATLTANRNLTGVESKLQTTGDLNLLAGDKIQIRDSVANPFIAKAAGNLFIQGNQGIDILALNHPEPAVQSGGNLSLVSNGIVSGDAHFTSAGKFSILNLAGNPGNFISLYDPIIRSNGDVTFGDYTGASLKVESVGNISAGNITITNPDASTSLPASDPDAQLLANRPTLILRAGLASVGSPSTFPVTEGSATFTSSASPSPEGSIRVGDINTSIASASYGGSPVRSGPVILSAKGDITARDITTFSTFSDSAGDVTIQSNNGNITTGIINASARDINGGALAGYGGGVVTLNAPGDITTGNIITSGGNQGNAGNINATGRNIQIGNIDATGINPSSTFPRPGVDGSVNVQATGTITTGNINTSYSGSSSEGSRGGDVILKAAGDITTGAINSSASNSSSNLSRNVVLASRGGKVNIEAGGNISTGNLNSSASYTPTPGPTPGPTPDPIVLRDSEAGSVTLKAGNSIKVEDIIAYAFDPTGARGGLVELTASNTDITTGAINTFAFINPPPELPEDTPPVEARGGAVTFNAGSNISFSTINSDAGNLSGNSQNAPIIGGNVNITANGIVQGTGVLTTGTRISFPNSPALPAFPANTTIFTRGATSGTVRIQHDGGVGNVPFTVGLTDIKDLTDKNGTAGAIDAGATSRIEPVSSFPVLPNGGNATGTPTGITIFSVNSPPSLTANPRLNGAQQDKPFIFTFDDLNPSVSDVNGDKTSLRIDSITAGKLRLRKIINGKLEENWVEVIPGTESAIIAPGDSLEYTPASGFSGEINPFSISASDGVSSSAPQTIRLDITPPPPPPPPPERKLPPKEVTDQVERELPKVETPPRSDVTVITPKFDPGVEGIDDKFARQYDSYLGLRERRRVSLEETRDILRKIERETGVKPAIIYVSFVPSGADANVLATPQDSDQLDLMVVTAKGEPVRKTISTAKRELVLNLAKNLYGSLEDPDNDSYLEPAQELYKLIVAPLKEELNKKGINNLLFIADEGLRSVPFAALHDGKQFLVENYSVGFTPALSITDTRYVDIRNTQVLAMGASKFQQLNPLPAVPEELSIVAKDIWSGKFFLNQNFTLNNLKSIRSSRPFGIIHLATHGEFETGAPDNSYVQFWDSQLKLSQMRDLGLNNPTVELLVLSACRTALGDREAELGFGGFAYKAGVKTALASLWQVSDSGTLGLMTEFYKNLKKAPIKAEALRQAQLAMIRGRVTIEKGQLRTTLRSVTLPPESPESKQNKNLKHPFYWAAFTMIGSPW